MCQLHSRDRLVSHYLLQSLDLLCCQPSTRPALTVSKLVPWIGATGEERGRGNIPSWVFLESSLTVGPTALLNCPPKAAVSRRAGTVALLCWQTEELGGCSILWHRHGPCTSWTVCCQRKALGRVLWWYVPSPSLARQVTEQGEFIMFHVCWSKQDRMN